MQAQGAQRLQPHTLRSRLQPRSFSLYIDGFVDTSDAPGRQVYERSVYFSVATQRTLEMVQTLLDRNTSISTFLTVRYALCV